MIRVIGFDADDTLWHNENHFQDMQDVLRSIIERYPVDRERVDDHLLQVEQNNLGRYGYGAKAFALSMIETAVELTGGEIAGRDIARIIAMVQSFLSGPTHVLDGVTDTLDILKGRYELLLITKGDELEQKMKLASSKLEPFFHRAHFVQEKDVKTYGAILQSQQVEPQEFLMVGNSVRSDIRPVLELGGAAVHIPYHVTWQHEHSELSDGERRAAVVLASIRDLPRFLERGRDNDC
ncbi:MAG: haloacid dehalogenase [Methylocystaceae bacterium]|nr:MAG: haloacid dehalogenase [Methylocystaceae bacterium]